MQHGSISSILLDIHLIKLLGVLDFVLAYMTILSTSLMYSTWLHVSLYSGVTTLKKRRGYFTWNYIRISCTVHMLPKHVEELVMIKKNRYHVFTLPLASSIMILHFLYLQCQISIGGWMDTWSSNHRWSLWATGIFFHFNIVPETVF